MVCPGSRKYQKITPFLFPKTVHITLPTDGFFLNFFNGEFKSWCSVDYCFDPSSQQWHHISSLIMMWCRKLSLSASYGIHGSWETCTWCSFCTSVSIHRTHSAQSQQYSNTDSFASNILKPIFNSVYCSLVIICQFLWMSWLRTSLFYDVTAVYFFWNVDIFHVAITPAERQHSLFGLHKYSANIDGYQWVLFCPYERVQWHASAPSILLCQTPFCQTAPLLPSATRQQNIMEYWWEGSTPTAVPPTVALQHNKIGSITFREALV